MLELTLGQTSEYLVITLNEKRTLDNGYYLFRFVHQTTKEVVSIIYNFLDDISDYQDRFNKFEINTSTKFTKRGFYNYFIYEQASSSNTDPNGLTEVEQGISNLLPAAEFEFEEYSETTTYKSYNG
jgi:hypothetical protein